MSYPVIPITQFYNNAVTYDPRVAKVELGKGGVLDRSRIHFFNNTRKSYSINATLKDKDTLQNFLELNRGKPFEFRYDGANSAGLYICKTWSWDWVVYVEGVGGVWNFSATFEQVFRPGWTSQNEGLGTLFLSNPTLSGIGDIISNLIGSGNLIVSGITATGLGEITQSTTGSGNLFTSTIEVSGVGDIINIGQGTLIAHNLLISGDGTFIPIGSGDLEVAAIQIAGVGTTLISGTGGLTITNISLNGSGDIISYYNRITEAGNQRTTEAGNIRTTEAG